MAQPNPKIWLTRRRYRVPALAVFFVLALLAHAYAYFLWDLRAACGLQMSLSPSGLRLMEIVSLAGNGWTPYLLTACAGAIFLLLRQPVTALGLVLCAGGSGGVNALLKWLVGRPRPIAAQCLQVTDHFGFLSFPSGHVTFYVCFFGFLWLLARERLPTGWPRRVLLMLLTLPVLLIGFSRVSLGAHWPSDTLGAYLWSGVWLGLIWELSDRYSRS